MANKGYILLARAIEDSEIWSKPPYYLKAWIHILCKAAFKPYGNLKTGECIVSTEELQEVCSYKAGRRTEKPSTKQIRDFMDFLRSDEGHNEGNNESPTKGAMIVTMKVKGGMLVKVLNYERYQASESYESNNGSNNESQMKVTTKVVRKSDEGTNQIKEALKALESLETLEDHLSNKTSCTTPFPDIEKQLEEKEQEQQKLYGTPIIELYEERFNRLLSQRELQIICQWKEEYDDKLLRYAFREMLVQDKNSVDYVDRILLDWKKRGLTAEQYEEGER